MELTELKFYVVQNAQGAYFRAKGHHGIGNAQWVDDPKRARVYGGLPAARRTKTNFSKNPDYPPPTILEISVGNVTPIK
jgi:hypothetical protein